MLLAHGSRDARHAATIAAIADATRAARPDLLIRVGYLDHNAPTAADALASLAAGGAGSAVAVPLLLGHAFHGRLDVPAALAAGSARTGLAVTNATVLGPDPELLPAVIRRVLAAGGRPEPGTGLVLACAGTTDATARAALARLAMRWRRSLGADVRVADAAGAHAGVAAAVASLRNAGALRVDVAAWFLAPGVLLDRVRADAFAAGADTVAAPLAASPEVVTTVLRRYDSAAVSARAQVA